MSSAAVPFTYKAVGIQTSRTENAISITLLVALILTSIVEKTTSLDSDPTADSAHGLSCDVAIIGGGITGLSIAESLLRLGKEHSVCVFEKDSRFGGRLYDYRFERVPDVSVALGAWRLKRGHSSVWEIINRLQIPFEELPVEQSIYEARGVLSNDSSVIKRKAFPTLNQGMFSNFTFRDMDGYLVKKEHMETAGDFATFESYTSHHLTPEGAQYFFAILGYGPDNYNARDYLDNWVEDRFNYDLSGKAWRPLGGMSAIVEALKNSIVRLDGHLFKGNEIRSVDRSDRAFKLSTGSSSTSFIARKVVFAIPPTALSKIAGSVATLITENIMFNSLQGHSCFKAVAVYAHAWWEEPSLADLSLEHGKIFVTSSNCLRFVMPYGGRGVNGEAILQMSYSADACSTLWGSIAERSPHLLNKELTRSLRNLFPKVTVPEPLETVYQYWKDTCSYLQKAGSNITTEDVVRWSVRPVHGQNVFLAGDAYSKCKFWSEGAVRSAQDILFEGWGIEERTSAFSPDSHQHLH